MQRHGETLNAKIKVNSAANKPINEAAAEYFSFYLT